MEAAASEARLGGCGGDFGRGGREAADALAGDELGAGLLGFGCRIEEAADPG